MPLFRKGGQYLLNVVNSNTCMLILVNRAEEKLSVQREIAKFLTVYCVCYTPIETLITVWSKIYFALTRERLYCCRSCFDVNQ